MTEEKLNYETTKAYISGKNTGIAIEHVEKKFQIAESFLKSIGMVPVNPINNGLDESHSKQEHLLKDIELLLSSDTIFILENWSDSKQSRIEIKIAEEYGMQIMFESSVYKSVGKIEKLKTAIFEVMGLKFEDFTKMSRKKEFFYARMIFINHCRFYENMNLHKIGELVNRDHTTVMHGIKTYKNDIKYNTEFREIMDQINKKLNQ